MFISRGIIFNPNNHQIFMFVLFLMVLILIDTFLIKFYDLINKELVKLEIKKIIFSLTVSLSLVLQFIIINYVKNLSRKIRNNKLYDKMNSKYTNNLAQLSLFVLGIIFSFLIFQLYYSNSYNSALLISIVLISYLISSIFITKNLLLFIYWFRLNRNSVFFLYSLSMFLIISNLIITSVIVSMGITDRPQQIRPFAGGTMDISVGNYGILINYFKTSTILSFVSIWLTTALIMHTNRDRNIGKLIQLTILILPLAYFLFSYFAENILSGILLPFLRLDPVSISIIFTAVFILSKPIGGITFGFLYWNISKLVKFDKLLREYMIIAGYGFLLLFSANQSASLVLTPYPPFGIVTITVLISATYLIFIGIYKSATTASANAELRRYVYQIAKESRLLDLIGRTEMEREINNAATKVFSYTSSSSFQNNNFELQEEELKDYIKQVVEQLRKEKLNINK